MEEKCQFLSLHASYLPIQVLKTSLTLCTLKIRRIGNWILESATGPLSIRKISENDKIATFSFSFEENLPEIKKAKNLQKSLRPHKETLFER